MANEATNAPKEPLGVGSIISDGFSIMFGNFVKVLLLGFLGAFLGFVVNIVFLGFDAATGAGGDDLALTDPTAFMIGIAVSTIIGMVIYGLVTAMLIQLAYDSKLGRSNSLGTYFRSALPAILPIAVLTLVISILSAVGAIALIIGALWVYAVFYVTAPVAVIERGGFGSMGRSAVLTKEYRWPIVGMFIVVIIISMILQFIGGFFVGGLGFLATGLVGQLIIGVGLALITGLAYAYGGIVVALVYARLREVKNVRDLIDPDAVFDFP
ncbi:MAG: hypothetical protein AAFP98_06285 [Pseudomonadota bacterium]